MSFRFNFQSDDSDDIKKKHEDKPVEYPETAESQVTFTLRAFLQDWVYKKENLDLSVVELKNGEKISYVVPSFDDAQEGIDNILKKSDVVRGVYEGGFKLWEGSIDLADYVCANVNLDGQSVLELGCGIGLPGILAAKRRPQLLIFQDFNHLVLSKCTAPSVFYNLTSRNGSNNCDCIEMKDFFDNIYFIAGNWRDIVIEKKVDFILTSETIYQPQSFSLLHDVIDRALSRDGVAYIASKVFYFGVGGGTAEWAEFVAERNLFHISLVKQIDAPLRREIWKMIRK